MPRLELSSPQFGSPKGFGIQPPRLIPPLQWPGPPFTLPVPFLNFRSFSLFSNSFTSLPDLTGTANALGLKVTVPTRKDPRIPLYMFMLRLTDGGNGLPNIVFGAWGDGKFFLNFETKHGESRPAVQAEGQVFLGLKGVF